MADDVDSQVIDAGKRRYKRYLRRNKMSGSVQIVEGWRMGLGSGSIF